MATFNTPGVYIQEISTLPPSVAPVPTSIPVFIGYTERATRNGDNTALLNKPTRIETMLDFQTIFGGAYNETFDVTLTGPEVSIDVVLDQSTPGLDYRLFYHMQMFFANGGGTCYIISVGDYTAPILSTDLQDAIAFAEQVDEITMVVIPEAVSSGITDAQQRGIYDTALAHCSNMQDRFAIFDVKVRGTSIADDALQFRNLNVSSNNLSYGAAYYPSVTPTLSYAYDSATTVNVDASAVNLPGNVQLFDGLSLSVINNGVLASVHVSVTNTFDGLDLDIGSYTVSSVSTTITDATDLGNAINANANLLGILSVTFVSANDIILTAVTPGTPSTFVFGGTAAPDVNPTSPITGIAPDKALFNRIALELDAYAIRLYLSATMAGIYTAVDTNRGVWKAPANLSLSLVSSVDVKIKDSDQEGLNVDATSGKSIDAIRNFPGRGILVWGARTLDGNSNEWRYVNVRRTFLFVEDSCKKATEFSVFEPNDKNLWVKVKGTISNFLTNLWTDGALAGSKPEQAFFVNVGLGETMTAQDILEGKLIVQIGMAVVRPAEFIVIQFEHKLQEA